MFRFFLILLVGCAALLLPACTAPEREIPIWKQVKISDLAPKVAAGPNQRLANTINLSIYIFDIPAADANVLDNIWAFLYTQPLRFNDYDAFTANLFAAGFSQLPAWNSLGDMLRKANAKRAERDSLILLSGQPEDIPVAAIDAEKTIFYISTAGRSEGVTIGPGSLSIRLKAKKIPGQRGVCDLSVQPIFSPLGKSRMPRSANEDEAVPFEFEALGFHLKASPGDFFLLGPKKYTTDRTGLAAIFFSREDPRPVARLYMFLCGDITD